ncbi:hypothetical protein Ga0080559_TMP2614 [Salipiger profundus]|uniref:Uncharacterized protein n=1 Tax=Salipiger profundus TaxID=1229727 RepID=A0A1U7D5R3_9RHOB|nr:hypothetical protein Ga0080559_TMP2614 [Salipiger profundus]
MTRPPRKRLPLLPGTWQEIAFAGRQTAGDAEAARSSVPRGGASRR